MSRRRPSLRADPTERPRPWIIRLPDGQVRGPLSVEDLASLAELGIVCAATEITPSGESDWRAIGTLPMWAGLSPQRKLFALRPTVDAPGRAPAKPAEAPAPPASPGPSAMDRARRYRERETGRLLTRLYVQDAGRLLEVLGFAAAVAGCVCLGDVVLFGLQPFWHPAFVVFSLVVLSRLMASWFVWQIIR